MPDPREPRIQPLGSPPPHPSALVLVLHGGQARGHGRAHPLRPAYLRMLPFARELATAGRPHGVAVGLLRYRYRGWNGADRDTLADLSWALDEHHGRHPTVPVVLLGHSMGGRAALLAPAGPAGAQVRAVCALAPWLVDTDPVEQLAGRTVLIAHGDRDRLTDPSESYAYAVRAREVTDRVCRFEVRGDGHALLRRHRDWSSLVRRFVLGELGVEPVDPEIAAALREPIPGGLRAPLAATPR
ncbi:MAG TPA: alpha/beta fold hydrolase [Pseudonocardia sp.]|nr:alpha/beta fold hydrolase [Pseudonocardia sp.]